ncbi:hypothetical protein SteCoe_34013 [Stentor coeruleus]|uniref:Transmembrane protein n=1 Tax=Stentor coeruleus TaxID=5963 RepID=A0A1R2AVE0_9CILI|nr:hypothetical protein SteCoe_34013 [Stentor coeruleus]
MIILVTSLLFPFVIACSECFSKCPNSDKTECLTSCGCPVFTETRVISGTFEGSKGLIYVPNVETSLSGWVELEMGCSLACAQECSLNYLDLSLEKCVNECGCESLLQEVSLNENNSIIDSCAVLCKGSGDGCLLNCQNNFGEKQNPWYLWLVFPIFVILAIMVMIILKRNKEDDYMLM